MKNSKLLLIICSFLIAACNTPEKSPIEYVNPFIGTGFHGHTYPGATTPFGGIQLSPDTRKGGWDGCSGYHYSDSTLLGFSHTHLSGTGCADLADVLIRPTTRPIQLSKGKEIYSPTRFFHFQEKARPGYYAVELPEEQIKAELTATPHAGMHRYSFQQGKNATIIIDLAHSIADWEEIYESSLQQNGVNEISGMRRTLSWVDNQHLYFVAQFSAPIQHIEYIQEGEKIEGVEKFTGSNIQGVLHFGQLPELTIKVGVSLVSIENARDNLNKEIPHFLFDSTRQQAENLWAQALSKIKIKGGNKAQRINFYTACYHSLLAPNIVSDLNHEYRKHDMTIGKMASYRKMYSTLSLWDTFRAWHPLMTLMDTTMVNDIVQSMLNMYDASGELPIWPLASGETRTMIGYHAASVIADAYLKGICRYDADKALEAMVVSSEINKKNAAEYIQHGYIPSNRRESVSCMLEYAYDDWTIAQMAKALGNEELYHRYIQRSQNYPLVFDGSTRFFRAKRQDGNWEENFNPEAVGREYTEATAWQYRFFVPHDVYGMVQLFGNEEEFEKALDSIFNTSKAVDGHAVDIS